LTANEPILVDGIECPMCKEQIWSRYGHDFRRCPCKYCFVDGGRSYLRYGWGDKDIPQALWVKPLEIKIDATEEIRDYEEKARKAKEERDKKNEDRTWNR